ncbi:hypothetical protein J3459_013589 [Metarhizium acridum]|nr:hypothetical protein J3459_013589 [Metarhizium acridum]
MPTGDSLAEPVVGAQLRAEATDEKRASLQAVRKHDAAVQSGHVAPGDTRQVDETSVLPTTEELALLRRVPNHVPLKLFTIAFIELCERFSYYGSTVVCK